MALGDDDVEEEDDEEEDKEEEDEKDNIPLCIQLMMDNVNCSSSGT